MFLNIPKLFNSILNLLDNQPSDIWHDPFFLTVLGIAGTLVAGLIGAFVAYWIYSRQRSKKEISYQIISNAPIASVNKHLENRVTIQVDGKPVKNARQVVLKIENMGNVAVKRDDCDEPIKFVFDKSDIC